MYANSLLGIWPYIFQDNPGYRQAYNIYSKFTVYYFILYFISGIVEFFILIIDSEIRIQDIVANLCTTLPYVTTVLRVSAFGSTTVRNLIKEILATEDEILETKDEDIVKIYKAHARQSQITNLLFIINISIESIFFFIHPLFVEDVMKINPVTNETTIIKALPLSSWFPYDPQEHYLISYIWQIFDGTIGASFVMFTDAFSFCLIIFPLGQIRILIHVLSNFPKYVMKVKEQIQCTKDEASFVTLRECVLKHKKIIRYLEEYNDSMKYIMLLDFLQSSLQLASIVIQLFVTEPTLFNVAFYGEFTFCMIIRLLVYYWYANEIILESINISTAAYECGWYKQPHKVKQMIIIMIMRANRALKLEIGPFATMTLDTFLGVMKTTYSYMMIMYR